MVVFNLIIIISLLSFVTVTPPAVLMLNPSWPCPTFRHTPPAQPIQLLAEMAATQSDQLDKLWDQVERQVQVLERLV